MSPKLSFGGAHLLSCAAFLVLCFSLLISYADCQNSTTCNGPETCSKGSPGYGTTCCCSQPCVEDAFDTVTRLDEGLWSVATHNGPAADVGPPENRMIVLQANSSVNGTSFLVLVNGVNLCNTTISGLKQLEALYGPILYVITPGDWHHVYLKQYNVHFPAATVYIPPGRIPPLEPTLKYKLLDVNDPLPELNPHILVVPMRGLRQPLPHLLTPRYEFGFFHRASKTLAVGDIMWYWSCEPSLKEKVAFPGAAKGIITFWDVLGMSMFLNKTEAAASARAFMTLPVERFINVHGPLGNILSPGATPSARDALRGALMSSHGPLG